MNRSLRKMLFREIRGSFTRFLSIFIMVALGTLFLVGLRSAAPDMRKTADQFFDDCDFYDIQILSTLGLTEEDLAVFSQAEGVEHVQGDWSLDALVERDEGNLVVKVHSLPEADGINQPELIAGRLPETANECVVEKKLPQFFDIKIGNTVTLALGEDMEEALTTDTFTVVGVVESPLYISIDRGASSLGDGSVDAYLLLPRETFSLKYYTVANLTITDARAMDAYSDEYQDLIDRRTDQLTAPAEDRADARYKSLTEDAKDQLEDAREELDAARARADTELEEAEKKLAQARRELDDGWAELEPYKEWLASVAPSWGQSAAFTAYQEALQQAEDELDAGETEYAQGLAELETARTETEKQLTDAQAEIDEAQEQLDTLEPPEVYVLDRNSNYGFVSYVQNAQRMDNLANMFPLIFYIVAALVCLTTMTRMVEEQRTEIGSIKAMGYDTGVIAWKFILYGAWAALGGGILGVAIGTTVIPWVIFTSYGILYSLPKLHIELYWPLSIGAVAAGLLCTIGATLWAMLSTAKETPAALMRPKAPKAGKRIILERIPVLWNHLSFSVKVSCRNLLRYKKRFFMTVVGIAGCTALMIAGLGLRSSIFSIIDVQYGDVYRYNLLVSLDTEDSSEIQRVTDTLSGHENVESTALAATKTVTISAKNVQDGYLTVTDDLSALYEQIDLRTMQGEPLEIPEDGVLISEKLAELLEVSVGDEITVECGKKATVPISGIVEHYVRHYVYMDASLYETLFDQDYMPNEVMVTTRNSDSAAISELSETLMDLKGVTAVSDIAATARSFEDTLNVVNAAVTIIILAAAALALVVLYNLTNINITERIRELATIKVLGFFDHEVAMYIYRENIALTILGILFGQFFGNFLCSYLIRTVEIDMVMFGRSAMPKDYVWAVVLSLIFALLVNFMMYFRMKRIDMVQSLKSVE